MKIFTVDLYEYFGLNREGKAGGYLTCTVHENSREINPSRLYPAMVVCPGGGYGMCSDREAEPIAEAYYAKGFNSFCLRYSCAPCRFPTQLVEASMAMAYVRRESAELCVDPAHVAIIGFSAGGHLCGSVATMYDYPEVAAAGLLPEEVRPDAAVLSYAVINPQFSNGGTFDNLCDGVPEVIKRTTIDELVTPNTPPMFIWTTYDDGCVNCTNSLLLALAAKKNEVPFNLHIYEKGQHGLSLSDDSVYHTAYVPEFTPGIEDWLDLSVRWMRTRGFKVID